jgi:hypothetical protein
MPSSAHRQDTLQGPKRKSKFRHPKNTKPPQQVLDTRGTATEILRRGALAADQPDLPADPSGSSNKPCPSVGWSHGWELEKHGRAAHGPHRDEKPRGKSKQDQFEEAQAEKAALADLNELFRDKEADSLRAEVLAIEDRKELQSAVDRWFDEKGTLPADSELLDKCMDVRKDSTLRRVIASLDTAMPDLDEQARLMLLRKAQTKGRRSFDAKLSKEIAALLDKHNFHDA